MILFCSSIHELYRRGAVLLPAGAATCLRAAALLIAQFGEPSSPLYLPAFAGGGQAEHDLQHRAERSAACRFFGSKFGSVYLQYPARRIFTDRIPSSAKTSFSAMLLGIAQETDLYMLRSSAGSPDVDADGICSAPQLLRLSSV